MLLLPLSVSRKTDTADRMRVDVPMCLVNPIHHELLHMMRLFAMESGSRHVACFK
jgi:hypothetical protein